MTARPRTIAREWQITRGIPGSTLPWLVIHLPTRIRFGATSQAQARQHIASGWWARQIALRLRPRPASRRDWHRDARGDWHLYTGSLCSWHCDLHGQVCNPSRRITADDILTRAARDTAVDDDVWAVLAPVIRGEPGL